MATLHFYTRAGCHLCEEIEPAVDELAKKYALDVARHDIGQDAEAHKAYMAEIPVVKIGPYTLKAPFSVLELEVAIRSAIKGSQQDAQIKQDNPPQGLNKLSAWLTEHWLGVMNTFFGLFLGGAFLPPIFLKLGWQTAGEIGYKIYSIFCHQLAFRSFFLFGEQTVYPRAAAQVAGLIPFGQASGLSELDLLGARAFEGTPILGYKIAMCERDIAIYTGLLLFGLTFALLKGKPKGLNTVAWFIFALIPIALDGGTQLLSQLPLHFITQYLPLRESTPLLRSATGFLFGLGTAWMGLPIIAESMKD